MKNKVHLFLAIFFLIMSFGQLEKIQFYSSLAIYIHEILMGLWLLYWMWRRPDYIKETALSIKKSFRWRNPVLLFCIWVCVSWFMAFFSGYSIANSVFYSARIFFYGVFIYSFLFLAKKNILDSNHLKLGVLVAGAYLFYFGILQYLFLPDTRFLQFLGWDDHFNRLISTILDPGFTGILFILTIFASVQLWRASLKIHTKWLFLLMAVFTLGIAFTYSRATYLAYGISGGVTALYCFREKKKVISAAFLASLLLLGVVIPFLPRAAGEGVRLERTSTIIARTTSAQTDLDQLKGMQWLTGQGLFTTSKNQLLSQDVAHNRVPDNWLVMILSGTGVVGLILFLFATGQFFFKNWQKNPIFWCAFLAVLIHGLFNASVIYVFVLIWLGVLYVPVKLR